MLDKDFETYYIRCKQCGKGKPKKDYKGSIGRVCIECRTKKAKEGSKNSLIDHFKR